MDPGLPPAPSGSTAKRQTRAHDVQQVLHTCASKAHADTQLTSHAGSPRVSWPTPHTRPPAAEAQARMYTHVTHFVRARVDLS